MKIHVKVLFTIIAILLLAGCGGQLETVPLEDEEQVEVLIDLVQEYKSDMVRVVNGGSFSELEHYLIMNHTYRNIRAYVKDTQSKKIQLNLVEHSVVDVSVGYQDDIAIYCVDVVEKVEEIEGNSTVLVERDLRYEIISHNDEYRIESIVGR